MILSKEERAARKRAQVARIAAKGTPKYSELYASQPEQIRQRAKDQAARKVEREVRNAAALSAAASARESASIFEQANSLSTVGGDA